MKKTAIILLTSAALSGCASIIKGGSQDIDITTNNGQSVNATIFTKSGIQETNIPQTIAVQKDSQDITITVKEGRCNKESVTTAKSHIQPWFWGNDNRGHPRFNNRLVNRSYVAIRQYNCRQRR